MEDLNSEFYAIAKRDKSIEAAHLCARLNERICAMNGWSSFNLKMDPIAAQAAEQLSDHEQIKRAILGMARGNPDYKPGDGNGAALAPPVAPSADDENPAD